MSILPSSLDAGDDLPNNMDDINTGDAHHHPSLLKWSPYKSNKPMKFLDFQHELLLSYWCQHCKNQIGIRFDSAPVSLVITYLGNKVVWSHFPDTIHTHKLIRLMDCQTYW